MISSIKTFLLILNTLKNYVIILANYGNRKS